MNLVAQNSGAGSAFVPRSELDEFLFAPVMDDANGMTLSVLSMLARAGVDPRSEAAALAQLPAEQATDALTSFIGGLPPGPVPHCNTETIVARLVALLPRQTRRTNNLDRRLTGGTPLTQESAVAIVAILICFLMAAIWGTAGRQSLAQTEAPISTTSALAAAPITPTRSVQ
jgi:hypothetical protein